MTTVPSLFRSLFGDSDTSDSSRTRTITSPSYDTDSNDPSQLFSPSLLLESGTFGLIDDSTLEAAGIPRTFDTGDLQENNGPGDSRISPRNLKILAVVAAFALVSAGVGQLFTFELGS